MNLNDLFASTLKTQCSVTQHSPWQVATCSSTGLRYLKTQGMSADSVGHRAHPGAMAVAVGDGAPGGDQGQVASASGVGYCLERDLSPYNHQNALSCLKGLESCVQRTLARHTCAKGATTLVAAWLDSEGEGWFHRVGDCRVYQWSARLSRLIQLAPDQSFTLLGRLPPEGVSGGDASHMLGIGQSYPPELLPVTMHPGDCLLLCSGGLHDFVDEDELADLLYRPWAWDWDKPRAIQSLARQSRQLVRRALANGSDDDISVLLLRYAPIIRKS